MPESLIDQTMFDGLKESVGADYIGELVSAFSEEAPTLIAQLRKALDAGDAETFRRAAHSIKSNVATFGAMSLFESARELEFIGRDNRLGEAGNKLEVLEEAVRHVIEELKGLCA